MPHRRRTTARWTTAIATATLAATTAPASPVQAGGLEEQVHTLVHEKATGEVGSKDGVFRDRCQQHPYRYRVDAGESDWSLELFLVDPEGERVGTGYEWKGADPARGRGRFRFCGRATRPGTYTVRARLTWDDGHYHETWLEPRKIRLRRP